jgi:hypothetical protein
VDRAVQRWMEGSVSHVGGCMKSIMSVAGGSAQVQVP